MIAVTCQWSVVSGQWCYDSALLPDPIAPPPTAASCLPPSAYCLLPTAFRLFRFFGFWRQLQPIELAIKRSYVNLTVKHRRRGINVIANLYLGNQLPINRRNDGNPTRLVTKDDPVVNHGRRYPNRTVRLVTPHQFALVGCQTVQVPVTRANVDLAFMENRAGPNAFLFAGSIQLSAFGYKMPG